MTWLKIDDGFDEHMKIEPLTDRSFRLHVSALCLVSRKLSDGHISATSLKGLLARIGASKKHVEELVNAELWLPALGGGYVIKDFLEYNRSREQVQEDRRKARDRMANLRSSGEQTENVRPNRTGGSSGGSSGTPSFSLGSSKTRPSADAGKIKPAIRVSEHDVPKPIDFQAVAEAAMRSRGGDAA